MVIKTCDGQTAGVRNKIYYFQKNIELDIHGVQFCVISNIKPLCDKCECQCELCDKEVWYISDQGKHFAFVDSTKYIYMDYDLALETYSKLNVVKVETKQPNIERKVLTKYRRNLDV